MEGGKELPLSSWHVKAGKRSYFFDVRATIRKDLYMTITESKCAGVHGDKRNYERHKIFLYKEDLENFLSGFENARTYIQAAMNEDNTPSEEAWQNFLDNEKNETAG